MTFWHWAAIGFGVIGAVLWVAMVASLGLERHLSRRTTGLLRLALPSLVAPIVLLVLIDWLTGHHTVSFWPYAVAVVVWIVVSTTVTALAFVWPRAPGSGRSR